MSIVEYLSQPQFTNSHKYDGIMLQVGIEELRAKWIPTGEADINGDTWELSVLPQPVLCRPRQGKKFSPMSTLVSQLRARFRGQFVVEFLRLGAVPEPVVQPMIQQTDVTHAGAKAMVLSFHPEARRLVAVFIREREPNVKPLDMLGGSVELGESPIEAMIREMYEETKWQTTADMYVEMGTSEGRDSKGLWKSYLFLTYMPWTEVVKRKDLEWYEFGQDELNGFPVVSMGQPKQPWFGRNWYSLRERIEASSLKDYYMYYQMVVAKDPAYPIALGELGLPTTFMKQVRPVYTAKILAYAGKIKQIDPSVAMESILHLLQKSWYIDKELQMALYDKFGHAKKEDLLPLLASTEPESLRKLLTAIFFENERINRQTVVNPFHLRAIIKSWGYDGSDMRIKRMIQRAIECGVIMVSHQSNHWGGLVYRLK